MRMSDLKQNMLPQNFSPTRMSMALQGQHIEKEVIESESSPSKYNTLDDQNRVNIFQAMLS